MTKSVLYLLATTVAGFFSFTMSACSVDYDGNDSSRDAELIGTWDAISSQYYAEGEGYSMPGPGGAYWVITDRTITEYDKQKGTPWPTADYTYDGRRLIIGGEKVCEVVALTRRQMLLRQPVQEGVFRELTFNRR